MWLKNMLVKMGSSSPNRGENKKYWSCHHPEDFFFFHQLPWRLGLGGGLVVGFCSWVLVFFSREENMGKRVWGEKCVVINKGLEVKISFQTHTKTKPQVESNFESLQPIVTHNSKGSSDIVIWDACSLTSLPTAILHILNGWSKARMCLTHGKLRGPPQCHPPKEIVSLIKGVLTIGFP